MEQTLEHNLPANVGGTATVFASIFMNIWNYISQDNINFLLVVITSIGGIIFLYYKIKHERKKIKLLDKQLEEKNEDDVEA